MEQTYYATLKRLEMNLLHALLKYTQFHALPRNKIGMFHVRLCGKPTSTTRMEQSLLYALLLPLEIGWGLRPHQFPREAARHIIGSVPYLSWNMVLPADFRSFYL